MDPVRQTYSKRRAQRGVSLLEILIVLVILVVGILAVVRLFPSGFFSIGSAGTAALADGVGQELLSQQAQASGGLPDSILPTTTQNLPGTLAMAQYNDADYDPDDPDKLDYARNVENETVTVPAPLAAGGQSRSLYTVNFGPIVLPVTPDAVTLPNYLTVNSPNWEALAGDSTQAGGVAPNPPQDIILPGQQRFLVDLTNGKIAVPYSQAYSQTFALIVVGSDGNMYTLAPIVPRSGSSSSVTDPHQAGQAGQTSLYLPDSKDYYNGNWFAPADTTLQYYATGQGVAVPTAPPAPWKSAMLYRPFQGVANSGLFTADPYQFTLPNGNMGAPTANLNLGVIQFNPLAAGGSGSGALKALISYQAYDWQIIHEDRDIPALNTGDQYIARLTLKGLKVLNQTYPDTNPDGSANANTNMPYLGIAGSNQDVMILDLDTGAPVPPAGLGASNNEDKVGTLTGGATISVGHSVGRVVFGSGAFGDTVAHRVRIFYQCVGDWTVAAQKAPAAYSQIANVSPPTDPQIGPAQCALDAAANLVYFPRCDVGRTIEVDGSYTSGGTTQTFSDSVSIDNIATLGATRYGFVDLTDTRRTGQPVPTGATVTLTAVRGLSSRAVVAWKERNRWKVHSVDTVLTRAQ